VGNPAGRRVSRTGPGMAHCGGPRIQACVRAHRAQARCRVVGRRPFGYFWVFPKVTRCKSGTIGSRYRSNGYVLTPQKKRSSRRPPRKQAPSPQPTEKNCVGTYAPMAVGQLQMYPLTRPHREQAPSHICTVYTRPTPVGSNANLMAFAAAPQPQLSSNCGLAPHSTRNLPNIPAPLASP
jgi:hypothetical protein